MTVVTERRDVPYSRVRMFALVADVESYPEFLPEYVAVRIEQKHGDSLRVRQVLKIAGRRFDVVTDARAVPPGKIEIAGVEGPFRELSITWNFDALDDGGCRIRYRMDLETGTRLLTLLAARIMAGLARRTLARFELRARELHGRTAESDISA